MSEEWAPLRALSWHRLTFRLRNRRNRFAREHPLFIFKALCKFACGEADPPLTACDYLFHPVNQPFPRRVGRGQSYEIHVVFPLATADEVQRFRVGLERQLAKPPINFEVEHLGQPQPRSLAELEREILPSLDLGNEEICLDFLTPLVFKPRDLARPWLLEAPQLVQLCTVHLARLFPAMPWPLSVESEGLRALPYFWESDSITHESKSQPPSPGGQRTRQRLEGYLGPLYLRGSWPQVLPLLLLCSELHTGYGKGDPESLALQRHAHPPFANPQGAFRLRSDRPFFDRLLHDPARFLGTARALAEESDAAEELRQSLDGGESVARTVAQAVACGTYVPGPAQLFAIGKKDGTERPLALLAAPELIVHRTLHQILVPACDRMLEHASIGYRPGRSVETARALLREAIAAGAGYALRADIETFFEALDWAVIEAALHRALPVADTLTRAALAQCIRTPVEEKGRSVPRTAGLLQGSPLSPLLANLCLDAFDEEIARRGHRLIRFGDDFAILTLTQQEAERALADVNELLAPLKLWLNPAKTAIAPLDLGFTFLGLSVPTALNEETVLRTAFRKTLFLTRPYAFAGVDGDSLVVRKEKTLLARVPLRRLSEVVFLGDAGVSTRLLQRCASLRIPVSFCSAGGWYSSTLRPDSKAWFGRVAAHARRYEALGETGRLAAARRVIEAKLRNHAHWMSALPGIEQRHRASALLQIARELPGAGSVEALRGFEGSAARLTFATLGALTRQPGFTSAARLPREKPDWLNTLLDLLYSLLFTRLNVLVRGQGLDPYLGFLHSPLDHYESLVCDLQEPFRARMDRLALKLINRREVTETSFEQKEGSGWRFTRPGLGVVLEAFEREAQVRLAGEPSTFEQLLMGQVLALRHWAEGVVEEPAFFVAAALRRIKAQS